MQCVLTMCFRRLLSVKAAPTTLEVAKLNKIESNQGSNWSIQQELIKSPAIDMQ